ncbi:MAG: HDOD domain-containing protein, partial [Hydrogenobaculum sp.]
MNNRKHLRFYTHIETQYGIIKNISYEGALIELSSQDILKTLLENDNFSINILEEEVKAKVVLNNINQVKNPEERGIRVGLSFEKPISKDTLQKAIKLHKKPEHIRKEPKFKIEIDTLEAFEAHDFIKGVMPIIMELTDENTNVDKIYALIRNMPKLEENILEIANNAYSNKGIDIKDIKSAIIRLGLSRIRDFTLKAISKEAITEYKDELIELTEIEKILILQTAIFDNICQIACTQRSRFYDLLVLSMIDGLLIVIDFLNKNKYNDIKTQILNLVKTPSKLYSYISRIFEKDTFGKDMIKLNKEYFEKVFYGFDDFIKSIIIGYNTYAPYYKYSTTNKLQISKQAINLSFTIHLSILGTKFIMQNDEKAGFIMLNRLNRFGIDSIKFSSFLKNIINDANLTIRDLGVSKEISSFIQKINYIPNIEGENAKEQTKIEIPNTLQDFYNIFIQTLTKLKRVCVRYEDKAYTMLKIENLINFIKETQKGVLGVIDLNTFEIPSYEDISFLDILVLKDIDNIEDIGKLKAILDSFEGYIIMTLRNDIDLETINNGLFNIIVEFTIEFPSYMEDDELYADLIKSTKNLLKKDFGINQEI